MTHTPGTRRFTFDTVRSGQPRPYADSVTEIIVTVEWIPAYGKNKTEFEINDLNEKLVKSAVKGYHPFKEEGDADVHWSSSMLTTCTKLGPGKWRFVITTAFTD